MPAVNSVSMFKLMWNELDLAVDSLMELHSLEDHAASFRYYELKGQITGLSSAILLVMKPIFSSIDEVKREANKRFKARVAGVEYETAGVEYSWRPGQATPGRAVPVPELPVVPPETIDKIYGANDSGLFTVDQLAALVGLAPSVVQLILDHRK